MRKFDARSYAAANTFPLKILINKKLILSCLEEGKVLPIHLQLNPTNKCNFHCSICSCSSRDKSLELPLEKVMQFMRLFRSFGGEAVTITGGGDPIAYDKVKEMISRILGLGIKIGLVCNGSLWHRIEGCESFGEITWIRVSSSDVLPDQLKRIGKSVKQWYAEQEKIVNEYPMIDWAFSHVVTEKTDCEAIAHLIDFANSHNFTHVRLVNDILHAHALDETMILIKQSLMEKGVDDEIVNYQDRTSFAKGTFPCYISLLKPVLAADGQIYPCCGTQYALLNPSRDYEKSMTLGFMENFEAIINRQQFFDGRVCVKCYYSAYNEVLGTLMNSLSHREFV